MDLAELKAGFAQESDAHDRLRVAVDLLRERLGIGSPNSADELIGTVESMPQRVHEVAVASLQYGIRQTLAIARSHYEDIDLAAISRGFPLGYTDEALDEMEREAAPLAEALASAVKSDDEFPFKPE